MLESSYQTMWSMTLLLPETLPLWTEAWISNLTLAQSSCVSVGNWLNLFCSVFGFISLNLILLVRNGSDLAGLNEKICGRELVWSLQSRLSCMSVSSHPPPPSSLAGGLTLKRLIQCNLLDCFLSSFLSVFLSFSSVCLEVMLEPLKIPFT